MKAIGQTCCSNTATGGDAQADRSAIDAYLGQLTDPLTDDEKVCAEQLDIAVFVYSPSYVELGISAVSEGSITDVWLRLDQWR